MEGRLLEERKLGQGLTIYFYDRTKSIVGSRCQVQLLIDIPLEIKPEYFEGFSDPAGAYEAFTAAFGREISFRQEKTRNFISESESGALLDKMKDEFLGYGVAYISKPNFARNYVLKKYGEWEQQRASRAAHEEAVRRAG